MAVLIWQISIAVFIAIATLHLHTSPFTKVEESFNIQAVHDILNYGIPISNVSAKFEHYFDHMTFPGAVPRTFIGSLIVSGLAKPQIWIGNLAGKAAQIHVRAVLGGLNATALAVFARSVQLAYGPIVAAWYIVLQASQFHLWYYASRTLPNMFAFPLSTIALAMLLPAPFSTLGPAKRARLALYLLTVAVVIFRSELALLLGSHCLWLLLKPETLDAKVRLVRTVMLPSVVAGGIIALFLTTTVDSYFWQSNSLVWPELSAFISNVFPKDGSEGASAWGTQPFYWYLLVALPRLLMNQVFMIDLLFLSPVTWQDVRVLDNLIPSHLYLVLYSILPHKETRFLFPIVPSLTLVAALTCARLTINAKKTFSSKILLYLAAGSVVIVGLLSHAILLPLSALNYPGGHALESLHLYHHNAVQTGFQPALSTIHVHLTNLALQSGVTRFLEQPQIEDMISQDFLSAVTMKAQDVYNEERPVIILQGDEHHPALTITPPTPKAVGDSTNQPHTNPRPYWIYDKTSNDTEFLNVAFWEQFDYAIVESPHHALGAWTVVEEVKALGRPRILRPNEDTIPRYHRSNAHWKTFDRTFWLMPHTDNPTAELLSTMYPSFIAAPLSHMIDLMHDSLRLQDLSPFGGLTRGYWLDVPLETRLYILKRSITGMNPKFDQKDAQGIVGQGFNMPKTKLSKEADLDTPMLDAKAAMDQEPLGLDALGPLVVNKDGTLSRLDNWQQMTSQEKKRTVEYLKKRNIIRLEGAEAVAV